MQVTTTKSREEEVMPNVCSALQDIPEPNLLRAMFPYEAVPRVVFDGDLERLDPAPEFYITDTTFRDGQQARPPYSVQQIVDLYTFLHRLGGRNGIIRQAEFFCILTSTVRRYGDV